MVGCGSLLLSGDVDCVDTNAANAYRPASLGIACDSNGACRYRGFAIEAGWFMTIWPGSALGDSGHSADTGTLTPR